MDTRVDDEQARFGKPDDESQRTATRFDDESLSFRTQGIGADKCALSF